MKKQTREELNLSPKRQVYRRAIEVLNDAEFHLWHLLRDWANRNGECFVSYGMIMENIGWSSRTKVARHLASLERMDFLGVQRRYKRTNIYTILDGMGRPFCGQPERIEKKSHDRNGSPAASSTGTEK